VDAKPSLAGDVSGLVRPKTLAATCSYPPFANQDNATEDACWQKYLAKRPDAEEVVVTMQNKHGTFQTPYRVPTSEAVTMRISSANVVAIAFRKACEDQARKRPTIRDWHHIRRA
jgi:hypothetical protein